MASVKGYSNLHTKTSGAKRRKIDPFARYNGSIESFISNPENLGRHSSGQIYNWLKKNGMDPKPLSRGSTKGISYQNGGGYKVTWGGNSLFSYHPPGRHHGGEAYYKISNSKEGTKRYTLKGELKND